MTQTKEQWRMTEPIHKSMKPVIIMPKGLMSVEDKATLNSNGFCVVEAEDPARVKFIDPIPSISSRTEIERAAIKLSRLMLNGTWKHIWDSDVVSRTGAGYIFAKLLLEGTPLDENGTKEDQEQLIYDRAKRDELTRIAREDASAEAKAKRVAKAKGQSKV